MKNKIFTGFTVILAAVILIVLLRPESKKETEKLDELKEQSESKKSFVRVKTIKLARSPLIMYINTTGTAKAERMVDIYPRVSGFVKKIHVAENSYVNEGDILFAIENEQYELNFESAKDNLLKAKIEYGMRKDQIVQTDQKENREEFERELSLLKGKMDSGEISQELYENKKLDLEIEHLFSKGGNLDVLKSSTGLTQAMINYRKAQLDIEYSTVRSKIDGYVGNLEIDEGEFINSGTKCMSIVDYSNIIMEIPVLESEISQLQTGRNVQVIFEARKDTLFSGTVESLSPVIDRNTGTGEVLVKIPNNDLVIKSGMSGNVSIEGKIYNNRVTVPNEAVLTRDNRKLIFIAEEGKAKWVYVTTGLSNYNYTEIIMDKDTKIELGDEVIVTNNYTLSHDADIIIEEN
ncbi:MAG: efflux RND transporter periplasmic adaptor subunit [Candidatus Delongbacteria bacterium]